MPTTEHVPVAILGAGLTGLSAALACQREGIGYRLFERERVTGGLARTLLDSGYRFDRTGHLLHVKDPGLAEEVREWLGDAAHLIERKSVVWSHGVYTNYPFQANTHGLPPNVAYECVMGFLEARLAETTVTPSNFEEYCLVHFGRGISEHFMLPYNGRLWGVNPRSITSEWCQRYVPLPSLSDVIGGALGVERPPLGYNAEFIYPELGIGELAAKLTERVEHLELGRAPVGLDLPHKRLSFGSESVTYDHLVSSIPLDALLRLCGKLPEDVAGALGQLECTHLHYLDVALSVPCRQAWHWAYVPEARYPFYRVGCYSNFSRALVPAGCASLYLELVDRKTPDLAELMPKVIDGLSEMKVIRSAADIEFVRLRRIDHAYVIFNHTHRHATEQLHAFLGSHAVTSTGRYGEWTYSSMEDALVSGRQAVLALTSSDSASARKPVAERSFDSD